MSSVIVNLPQLTTGNFNNWKFRLMTILEEKQISIVLEKEESELSTEKERTEFKEKDAKAKSTIVQCLSDKHLDLVKDARTAKEMIQALKDVFERKSVFTKLTLKKKLLTIKLKKNEKLEDHFLNFDTVIRDLENAGSKMDEEDKVCYLLLTLNEDYDAVITAIETINQKINMEFVKCRLLDEEIKIKAKGDNKNVSNGSSSEEAVFQVYNIVCYKCGKRGHKMSDCVKNSTRGRGANRSRGRGYRFNENSRTRGTRNTERANEAEERISFIALNCKNVVNNKNVFILDSGATQNLVTKDLEPYMTNIAVLDEEVKICVANGNVLVAKKKGKVEGRCQGRSIAIHALIVEGMKHNLISVSELTKKGHSVIFKRNKVEIKGKTFDFECKIQNNLFTLEIDIENNKNEYCHLSESRNLNIWHRRLGHLNRKGLQLMGLPYSNDTCSECNEGKATRQPFKRVIKRSQQVGDLIHSDIAGPVTPITHEGYKYYQVIIDDFSHFVIVKLLKSKAEAADNVIDYVKMLKVQRGFKTKRIRCDNGGEYTSQNFKSFCRSKGIKIEYTTPYSPQQNGISERMNRTLMDRVRTKFVETGLPKELWGEAMLCSAYELNRCPTNANGGVPPSFRWYGKNDLSKLKIFGSRAWSVILPKTNKLEKRAENCIMVGYSGAGYRLWNIDKNEVICSRDVKFDETQTNYNKIIGEIEMKNAIKFDENEDNSSEINKGNDNRQRVSETEITDIESEKFDESDHENTKTGMTNETRTGRKINVPKYLNEYEIYTAYCLFTSEKDPENYKEASKFEEWNEAINKELRSHEKLNTWSEAILPEGKTAIETKWVFRTKEEGTKKARIVAKGFQIKEENGFESIYAPVARMSTIRLLLSVCLQNDTKSLLEAYSDADWATSKADRKSVSGSIIFYGNNPISWFSKKQTCVALSTAESEYIAVASCAQDLVNLKGVLSDLSVHVNAILYCDNKSAILMSKSYENSKRVKHIDVRKHFLKDLLSNKTISIDYVRSSDNLADLLTKPLCKDLFVKFRDKAWITL